MSINTATKTKFIIDLLRGLEGKFLTPREIGKKYHEKFFLPREGLVVEPAKHLHKVFQFLSKEGLIQTMGKASELRYGIGKTSKKQIVLQARFTDYYIKNSFVPIETWINDPTRPTIKGIDFRIVQKPFASLVHLLLYFSHPVRLKNDPTFGSIWIVKPKSIKYPNGKFEIKKVL